MQSLLKALGAVVATSVVTCIAVRLRWDFAAPEARINMGPGGPDDLAIWALCFGAVVYCCVVSILKGR
jgi:hypothetical protein